MWKTIWNYIFLSSLLIINIFAAYFHFSTKHYVCGILTMVLITLLLALIVHSVIIDIEFYRLNKKIRGK